MWVIFNCEEPISIAQNYITSRYRYERRLFRIIHLNPNTNPLIERANIKMFTKFFALFRKIKAFTIIIEKKIICVGKLKYFLLKDITKYIMIKMNMIVLIIGTII